jgi:hypothetical protein
MAAGLGDGLWNFDDFFSELLMCAERRGGVE